MSSFSKLLAVFFVIYIMSFVEIKKKNEDQVIEFEPEIVEVDVKPEGQRWDTPQARQSIADSAVFVVENIHVRNIMGKESDMVSSTGSGVVVAVDVTNSKSLILTANHVCINSVKAGNVVEGSLLVMTVSKEIVTSRGDKITAVSLYQDISNDLCIMEVSGIAGVAQEVMSVHPPRYSLLVTAGAPKGIWEKDNINLVDGYFTGIRKKPVLGFTGFYQFSIPVIGGMSGSGVFYEGKIVAIVSMRSLTYSHIGWGPGADKIKPFVDKSISTWKKRDAVDVN